MIDEDNAASSYWWFFCKSYSKY